MSTRWRFPTAAVALVLLGAGLGSAPAHATTPVPTAIYLAVSVDGPIPRAGSQLTLPGALVRKDTSAGVAGVPVTVEVRQYGEAAFHAIRTVTTGSNGFFTATYTPRHSFSYRFVFAGDATYGASSAGSGERVSPRVSIWLASYDVPRGGRVVAHGRTGPNRAGHLVRLYRGQTTRGGFGPSYPAPVLLASGRVHADGSYRLVGHARWTGGRRVFVQVGGGGGNTVGWSRYRWLTAR
ncbi:MAG TPA: hypothetical protein VJ872_10100 [Nocardioides sp.]|nr:hypothetical protein [Nocardioides sp.]